MFYTLYGENTLVEKIKKMSELKLKELLLLDCMCKSLSQIGQLLSTAAKAGSEIIVLYNVKSILTDNSI